MESRQIKVSRAQAAKYDGSLGVVCPTHILDEKGGGGVRPNPLAYALSWLGMYML